MTMAPEFSLGDRPFIVGWGRRNAPVGAPTVMLSPFPYEYDLPYGSTSGFCERLWQESPMDEQITLLFVLFANVGSDVDVDCRDALDQFRRVREFQPLSDQCWYWFRRDGKRSGKSMHEMLLDDIEAVG